ncbi:hypothetical protein FOZ61_002440, partial [Perkinsus olseni]
MFCLLYNPFDKNNLSYHQLHPRIIPLTPLSLPRLRLPLLQLSEDLIVLPNLGILFKPPLGNQPQAVQSDDHDESLSILSDDSSEGERNLHYGDNYLQMKASLLLRTHLALCASLLM